MERERRWVSKRNNSARERVGQKEVRSKIFVFHPEKQVAMTVEPLPPTLLIAICLRTTTWDESKNVCSSRENSTSLIAYMVMGISVIDAPRTPRHPQRLNSDVAFGACMRSHSTATNSKVCSVVRVLVTCSVTGKRGGESQSACLVKTGLHNALLWRIHGEKGQDFRV